MISTRKAMAAIAATAVLLPLAACGNSNSQATTSDGPVTITWWGWGVPPAEQVKDFNKSHPNIKVKFENIGSASDQYTSLNNAIAAGKGMPDVATIEYFALPQFVHTGKLLDLTQFGADKFGDDYTKGTWESVNINGGVYALPTDSGPMAFFYNKEVFDKAGVTDIPTTWDEYYEAAKKIRAVGSYITSDTGDAGLYDSMIWASGGHPYKVSDDGATVEISLTKDKATARFTEFWQKMIDEGLIDTNTKGWTDEWNHGLADGSIASLLTGAWMPANLESGAAAASGKWRVAQMPTWEKGGTENAENGGSSIALLNTGDEAKQKAAWEFAEYINHSKKGTMYGYKLGVFPATNYVLESDEFLNTTSDYFGGQNINKEFAEASKRVLSGWTNLPYEVYARNVFTDTVGKAFSEKSSLSDGVAAWQKSLVDFGNDQGFTVNK
ncbi:extracellular solute-binding protein [Bifidobacterium sp. SO4]|uniref:ABC transporter substrate-binding protein n=1 Tax=Bifidobacterium sp. SO4 TaxID=2809030 RepID=UPI001BDBB643|nr:extracellular solute-binding protein [Bifidobacterium sp. SO4]MBT1170644.1 extracellular solute-binding protein [Bifidobacterium sp. SO4]